MPALLVLAAALMSILVGFASQILDANRVTRGIGQQGDIAIAMDEASLRILEEINISQAEYAPTVDWPSELPPSLNCAGQTCK